MRRAIKVLVGAISSALFLIIHQILLGGFTAKLIGRYGPWSYPVHFLWLCLGTVLVLTGTAFLARHPRITAWIMRHPRIAKWLTPDMKRLETRFWRRVRSYGALPMAIVVTWGLSPIFAAGGLRFLALGERRTWAYALGANVFVSIITVTFYGQINHFLHVKLPGLF